MPTEFVIQKIVNCNSESQTLNAILCKRHDPTRVFNAIIQLSEANGNEVNIVSSNENFSDVTGHFVPCYLPDGKSFSDLSVKEILTAIFHLWQAIIKITRHEIFVVTYNINVSGIHFTCSNKTIDGFELGGSRITAIGAIGQKSGYKYQNSSTYDNGVKWIEYVRGDVRKPPHSTYDLYFIDDKLTKLEYYTSGFNSNMVEDKYMDLVVTYGEPLITGNSSVLWKTPTLKIKFSYGTGDNSTPFAAATYQYYYYSIAYEYIASTQTQSKQQRPISSGTEKQYTSSGSGFVIATNGIIVTNFHVVDGANGIDVFVNRNGEVKTYNAKVLISDKANDISILKIEDKSFTNFAQLPYAVKTPILDVGTSVFALGYPMSDILGEEIKVTDGIISSKTGYQGDVVTYQISVPIQPGNSGGPLFDKNGNLVGITNAGVPDAQNVGYAIKVSYLKNLLDSAPTPIILPSVNKINT